MSGWIFLVFIFSSETSSQRLCGELKEMTEHTEDDTDTDNEAADRADAGAVALASVAIICSDTKLIIWSCIVNVDLVFVLSTWGTTFVHFCKESFLITPSTLF